MYAQYANYDRNIRIMEDTDIDIPQNFNFYLTSKSDKHIYSYDDDFVWESKFISKEIVQQIRIW